MASKVINGIAFNNPNAEAANDITEKVYKDRIDKNKKPLQPRINVVIQSEVKRK